MKTNDVHTGLKIAFLSITILYGIGFIALFVLAKETIYKSFNVSAAQIPDKFWIAERLMLIQYVFILIAVQHRAISKAGGFGLAFQINRLLKEISLLLIAAVTPIITFQLSMAMLVLSLRPETTYIISVFLFSATGNLFLLFDGVKKNRIVRGAELLPHAEAKLRASKAARSGQTFKWGGVDMPIEDSVKHMLLVGLPGSGKSKLIQLFMESVLPVIGTGPNHKALLYGGKRNEMSLLSGMKLNCEILYLNPFDERSVAWDIAKDIDDRDIARTITEASFVAEEKNSSQPYFRNTAALIINACMQALHKKRAHDWDFRHLVLVTRTGDRIKKLISSVPEVEYYVEQHCKDMNAAFAGVLSHAAGQIDWLVSFAALSQHAKRKISLREWVKKEQSILVLGCDFLRDVAMSQVNRMILTFLTLSIQDLPDDMQRRIWMILDEFATLGQVEKIKPLLYTGRSKGVSVLLAFQEIAQMIQHYGKEGQRIITGNTANKVILSSTDPDTQKWAESLFGGQEKYEESHSQNASVFGSRASVGRSEAIRERTIVLASEFGNLDLASPVDGISGFAKSPTTKNYKFHITASVINQLSKPDEETPDFIERPAHQRELENFNDDEKTFFFGGVEENELKVRQKITQKNTEEIKSKISRSIKKIEQLSK